MLSRVQSDFDRIALIPESPWNHNSQYHPYLLRALPSRLGLSLDVGCGTGSFSALLAERSDGLIAVDVSPKMIQVARSRLQMFHNIEFRAEDFITSDLPTARFDCVSAIAVVHHVKPEAFLAKAAGLLRPGGVLLLLDLYTPRTVVDYLASVGAVLVSTILRIVHTGKSRESSSAREAWSEHSLSDTYPTLDDARDVARRLLPNATVRRHLLWRYSIVWKKPFDVTENRRA